MTEQTISPDELRALAGKLRKLQAGEAYEAADYLRACADAKPVAWMHIDGRVISAATMDQAYRDGGAMQSSLRDYTIPLYAHPAPAAPHPAVPTGYKLVPVDPTPEMLDEGCDVDARAEVIKKYAAMPVIRNPENYCSCGEMLAVQYRAMLAAAPAAPQAEPCIGNDPLCPCQDGDACHYKDGADGTKAWSVPQAEPKRDWSAIDAAICEYLDGYELIGENDAGADACYTPTERECDLIYDAINGLLADEHFMRLIAPHPAPAAPQAEPKRKPACLWSSADDDTDVWETGCGHAFMIIDGTPGDNHMEFCCYCGRPLEQEIGGSDAE